MGLIHGENTYFSGSTQLSMSGNIYKCHCLRHEKILDGYGGFNTSVVVVTLRATTNFRHLYVQHIVMTLEASIVSSRRYHNINNTPT